jgi:hypothetical protein
MAKPLDFHEEFSRESEAKRASARAVGLVWAGFLAVLGIAPLAHGGAARIWALAVALAFLLIALLAPRLLAPFARLWSSIGTALHHLTNPIILFLLFTLAIVPVAALMRLFGHDPLRLRRDPQARSYWIPRAPKPVTLDALRNRY